jgi:ADP-L-glycero-D-manno-heptose 6-epimerase
MEPMIEYIEMPNSLKGRYQYDTLAEIGKLRGIGYGEPNTPIGEAIRDYVVNYLVPGRRLGYDTASR